MNTFLHLKSIIKKLNFWIRMAGGITGVPQ
jgi:hypothetical protein